MMSAAVYQSGTGLRNCYQAQKKNMAFVFKTLFLCSSCNSTIQQMKMEILI